MSFKADFRSFPVIMISPFSPISISSTSWTAVKIRSLSSISSSKAARVNKLSSILALTITSNCRRLVCQPNFFSIVSPSCLLLLPCMCQKYVEMSKLNLRVVNTESLFLRRYQLVWDPIQHTRSLLLRLWIPIVYTVRRRHPSNRRASPCLIVLATGNDSTFPSKCSYL